MQDKARKAWRGKENLVGCHVCYGLNGPSSETYTAGKLGTGSAEEFVVCKTCKYVQERINTEGGERKVARTEAMDLKRELWQKLVPKLQRADRAAAPPVPLSDLGLTEEGEGEEESADRDPESAAQARQSEPTSEVEISRDAPPAGLPPPSSPAPATPAAVQDVKPHIVATPVSVPSIPATPVSVPAPSPAPSSAAANHTAASSSAAATPVGQGGMAQDVAADREAEAIRLREEMVALIESHLRKGGGVRGGGTEEVEEEGEEEEELEVDEGEEEDFDERPRTGTGKAKSRK